MSLTDWRQFRELVMVDARQRLQLDFLRAFILHFSSYIFSCLQEPMESSNSSAVASRLYLSDFGVGAKYDDFGLGFAVSS